MVFHRQDVAEQSQRRTSCSLGVASLVAHQAPPRAVLSLTHVYQQELTMLSKGDDMMVSIFGGLGTVKP